MNDTRNAFCAIVGLVVSLLAMPVSAQQLTGTGEWRSLSSDAIKGTWTAALEREGREVSGTLKLTGSNVFAGGAVSGDIDTSSIVLGVMVEEAKQATFSGKLEGERISGEWESPVVGDHGVWTGTLSSAKPALETDAN